MATTTLLEQYFPKVMKLETYVASLVDNASTRRWTLLRDDDSEEYQQLVKTSWVGSHSTESLQQPSNIQLLSPTIGLDEVVERAQVTLLKKKEENILTTGFKLSSQAGLVKIHPNTIITALKSYDWEILLNRVGVDIMLHLLTQTSTFVALPNECLCQVTGKPLIHIRLVTNALSDTSVNPAHKRPADTETQQRPEKRPRLIPADSIQRTDSLQRMDSFRRTNSKSAQQETKIVKKTPNEIIIARSRLFYGRPTTIPDTQQLFCGLQPKHVLNMLISPIIPKLVDYDARQHDTNTRHLAKYVFPRQYGLPSAFSFEAAVRGSITLPSFEDREDMIKAAGKCKTPKRLKEVLLLLDRLLWRHSKCKYHLLRDKTCPSKIKDTKTVDKSIILEMLSGETSQLRTQGTDIGNTSVDSCGNSIIAMGLTQAKEETKYKPRIVDYACPYVEVYRYAFLITKTVIPQEFWGSKENYKLVQQHIKEFVKARRFESLSLHRLVQGFSTANCEWLAPPGDGSRQTRVSVSDALKRRELLEDFLYWFFDSFMMSLLKTAFYVTESASFRNRVLYFRQDDWKWLCAPLIEKLTSVTFQKMAPDEAKSIIAQRKLGFSFVRLLPKDTGVRPIVNLRRKSQKRVHGSFFSERSINQILSTAFDILTYERQANPHMLGMSVTGRNDVYTKLKQFKTRMIDQSSGKMPKLYFLKVDVQACFDTIEQTKLLEILEEVISHEGYLTQRYGNVSVANGRVVRKYMRKAVPDDERPDFLMSATRMAASLHHTIFVDQVAYPSERRTETLDLLRKHINDNIVKIGEDYYRQMIGIPQGSVLSSILCAFFYGDMEKNFKRFTDDPRSVMLRLIDDYLFVTSDVDQARGFLDMMGKGHPEYGCFISKNKTMTNFDYDHQVMNVIETPQFPWCGYLIDMRDLSVSGDYTRYEGTHLRDTLTVSKDRRPGLAFTTKMLQLAKAKSHAVFSDSSLSCEHIVYLNIYQNFLLCAMKMHGYVSEWGLDTFRNGQLIFGTVKQVIAYCFASLRSMGRTQVAKDNAYASCHSKTDVFFLGWHAFHRVLSAKPRSYVPLMKYIRQDMRKPVNVRRSQRFGRLMKEGWASVERLPF